MNWRWRDLFPILDRNLSWLERILWQWFIVGFPTAVVLFLLTAAGRL